MRFPAIRSLAFGISMAAVAAAETPAAEKARIAEEITALADDAYAIREKASMALWQAGQAALDDLRAAARDDDPERAHRARELVRKIELHLMPTTDPVIVGIAERYESSSITEKTQLLHQLIQRRAWRQALKLYQHESDGDLITRMKQTMHAAALAAARESLLQDKPEEALEYLHTQPDSPESLVAIAAFHRGQGTLDAELAKAVAADRGRPASPWQLALLRATGDVAKVRNTALQANQTRLAAAMAMLLGDPLPWMSDADQLRTETPATRAYTQLAILRWNDRLLTPADLEPLTALTTSEDENDHWQGITPLFLLGETSPAEAALIKSAPLDAFAHFESLERPTEALAAFDLDPEKPDWRGWIETRFQNIERSLEDEEDHSANDIDEFFVVASFMERRGMSEELQKIALPLFAGIAEKHEEAFLLFLANAFGGVSERMAGAPQLARTIAKAWIGHDEDRCNRLLSSLSRGQNDLNEWWSWMIQLDPEADAAARFDGLLALFHYVNDPDRLSEAWLEKAWQAVDEATEDDRQALHSRLFRYAVSIGDAEQSLRAYDRLDTMGRSSMYWVTLAAYFTAVERWEDATEIFLRQLESAKENPQLIRTNMHAYAATCLRRSDKEKEARVQDEWVEKLALGDPHTAHEVALAYRFGGDLDRAAKWWRRALIESDSDYHSFSTTLQDYSELMMLTRDWKTAAATAEVAAQNFRGQSQMPAIHLMRQRLRADLARAMTLAATDKPRALELLVSCHRMFPSDGTLADDFFPALRETGWIAEHDRWFEDSWHRIGANLKRYPGTENTMNTAAWLASRAVRRLDEAERLLQNALKINPRSPAYLDTMGEIHFAKKNRKAAVEWSSRAMRLAPGDRMIRDQHERFSKGEFPR